MNNIKLLFFLLFISFSHLTFSQNNINPLDTIVVVFNDKYKEFEKVKYINSSFSIGKENAKSSYSYEIEQNEKNPWSDNRFRFSHHVQSRKTYEKFGGQPPLVLRKPKSFLKGKTVLNINFFKTTPYIQIAKTFEKEDSWEQDVVIFIVDVDEIMNDSIVLREVKFTRPVKQ